MMSWTAFSLSTLLLCWMAGGLFLPATIAEQLHADPAEPADEVASTTTAQDYGVDIVSFLVLLSLH